MAAPWEKYGKGGQRGQEQRPVAPWEKYRQAVAQPQPPAQPQAQSHQAGSERTPFTAPNVTGNRTADIALEPVTGYAGRLNEAFTNSQAMAEHGLNNLRQGNPVGIVGLIPGAAGMAAAPISAALEPIARPINEYVSPILEKTFGTPPEISTPALTSLVPGFGVVKVPGVPKAPAVSPRGASELPSPRVKLSEAPTSQELRSQAGRAFKAADDAGVIYTASGVERLRQSILGDLEDVGFDTDLHPRVAAVLKRLDMASEGNLTLKGAEIIRRVAQQAAKSPEKAERFVAYKVLDQISEFLAKPEPSDVLMGDATAGAQALANAREIWARMSKSEAIDLAVDTALTRAKTTGSGANVDNAIRQNVRKILGKEEKPRGFSADEVKVLKEIAAGTPLRNALRLIGKAAPTGVVSGGFSLGATALTGPAGLIVPVVGFLAKIGADNLTKARARDLSARIRSGAGRGPEAPRLEPSGVAPAAPQNPLALPYYENRQR